MRHIAITCLAIGLALAINGASLAAGPGGTHASGTPSAGSQSFGRPSITSPTIGAPSSGTTGTTGSSLGSGSSPLSSGPSSTGPTATPLNSGSPFGTGSLNNEENGYPLTPTEGGGAVSPNQTGGSSNTNGGQASSNPESPAANNANGEFRNRLRPFEGRWWYPMANGHWLYWDGPTSSWVYFPGTATELANSAEANGQYSSGYRGLNNTSANGGATAVSQSGSNRWYWRNGQWFWFDGQTFQPAKK